MTRQSQYTRQHSEVSLRKRQGSGCYHLPRLTERFYRVDKGRSKSIGGTGLGLAISQRLVRMMGGSVWVDSTEGKGSCFGFRLPLPQEGEGAGDPPQLTGGLSRALVVSDHFATCELLSKQLSQLGLSVAACASGAEAIERATAIKLDNAIPSPFEPAQVLADSGVGDSGDGSASASGVRVGAIYLSEHRKIAVLNRRAYRVGEAVAPGWILDAIDLDGQEVVLRHTSGRTETHPVHHFD